MDENGLIIEALAQKLHMLRLLGKSPKFLYTMPNFQNPTGKTLEAKRRFELIELAIKYGFVIIEDDVYRDLVYEGHLPPSLYHLSLEHTIRIGSFSKIVVPGLRLGWLLASPPLIKRFSECGIRVMGGGANPLASAVLADYCASGQLDTHIQMLRRVYATRKDEMLETLAKFMPSAVSWNRPTGGMFVWLNLPQEIDMQCIIDDCLKNKVIITSGQDFFAEATSDQNFRLPFSYLSPNEISNGVATIADAIKVTMTPL